MKGEMSGPYDIWPQINSHWRTIVVKCSAFRWRSKDNGRVSRHLRYVKTQFFNHLNSMFLGQNMYIYYIGREMLQTTCHKWSWHVRSPPFWHVLTMAGLSNDCLVCNTLLPSTPILSHGAANKLNHKCVPFWLHYSMLITYLLTPWSRVLLEKLNGF